MITEPETTFEAFHARERPGLLRLAHLLTGSPAVGEDLVQDALIAVHRHWPEIADPAAYARTALVNLVRTSHRRTIRERRHLARHTVAVISGEPSVDEVWAVVRRLRRDQRAVVVLRFYADLSLVQIADELDLPLGTVKSTLHRAMKRLKETIDV